MSSDSLLEKELKEQTWVEQVRLDEPLSNKTSVRVGGNAKYFQPVHDQTELVNLLKIVKMCNLPWFIIGRGTNLLVHDEGFSGVVIQLEGSFLSVDQPSELELRCGAGSSNKKLTKLARQKGLSGIEFLATIPGSVGGAIFMNAGAHGDQICNYVISVEALDGQGNLLRYNRKEAAFSYRHSVFMDKNLIITTASFRLKSASPLQIEKKERELLTQRKQTQPINLKTWGSVFMNPPNDSAGRLIEACGLKGEGKGGARISLKHANFIENIGGATFQDLMDTIKMAKNGVISKFGIELKTEGQILSNHNQDYFTP
jgi:UDP-N-acetylmuramate dehydrogenase